MFEFIKELEPINVVVASIITSFATLITAILGVIINKNNIKKQFENEIKKKKTDLMIDKMSIAIEYILDVRNLCFEYAVSVDNEKKEDIKNNGADKFNLSSKIIYAFGSFDAITILESINKERKCNTSLYNILCLYQLLIVQIKYDLTDVVISSISWFEIVLTDYKEEEKNIIKIINNLVDELGLNSKFKIK